MAAEGRARQVAPWAVVAACVAFLVTPWSAPVWNLSSVFDRVQFPWRALIVFDVAACMLLALVLDAGTRWTRIVVAFMVAAMLFMAALTMVGRGVFGEELASLTRPADREDVRIAARADAAEYLPSCRPLTAGDQLVDGTSQQMVERALAERGNGVLPVLYYPFLTVMADGIEIPTACDPATGLIRADGPEGAVAEILKSTLPAERWGYAISAFSFVVLAGGLLWGRRRVFAAAAESA
jgi:hypothetical protein